MVWINVLIAAVCAGLAGLFAQPLRRKGWGYYLIVVAVVFLGLRAVANETIRPQIYAWYEEERLEAELSKSRLY